jgi:hypothetical protein
MDIPRSDWDQNMSGIEKSGTRCLLRTTKGSGVLIAGAGYMAIVEGIVIMERGERIEDWGRSCDRVDLGIVSRGLIAEREEENGMGIQMRLIGAEIWETIKERGGGDHVPISVVLAMRKC